MSRTPGMSRRDLMKLGAAGVIGYSMSGWLEALANDTAKDPQRKRACILLWMSGGPSQMETFDPKPGHANGGPTKEIDTNVPGIKMADNFPKLAKQMDRMVLVRSMQTKEADHSRGTYLMRTGRAPGGPVQYPTLGSVVAKELAEPNAELPSFVSIAPQRFLAPGAFSSGFLGPQYAPLMVADNGGFFGPQDPNGYERALKVQDLDIPSGVSDKRAQARVKLLEQQEEDFLAARGDAAALSHRTAYQRAWSMMRSDASRAFNLEEEPSRLRDAYGRNLFGQGCLLARRLVERGVPFVEVTLSGIANQGIGWDTHQENFTGVKKLCEVLDPAWATLMEDLKAKGLLDTTLIVWMGEFGRTPRINGGNGRDHWANSWSTVLAGGGIKGGQVVGKTSKDGTTIEERAVSTPDLLGTVALALGIDPMKQNQSNVGRPIRIVEPTANPIKEVVA